MDSTRRSLAQMFLYLLLVGGVAALLYEPLYDAYMNNWIFNSVISGVLLIGIIINFAHVLRLRPEYEWLRRFRTGETGTSTVDPVLLKPLARELGGMGRSKFRISALSLRTVLDGIANRLDEAREISRYIIGVLIFLGLLGTFWGLLGTIGAVGEVINALDLTNDDYRAVFNNLKDGLSRPLSGMGTAFSSSLLGLGGSLVLGFLDIQAGQAQNRFFNSLEEWLSSSSSLVDTGEVDGSANAALLHEMREQRRVLERLADSLQQRP